MTKQKIYVDTSVIGGCFDEEFSLYSKKLFDSFFNNYYIPVISSTVIEELVETPENVQNHYKKLNNLIILEIDQDVLDLANCYLSEKIITENYMDDAIHIAVATKNKIDILVSWNFKHIVNLKRIHLFNSINLTKRRLFCFRNKIPNGDFL